MCRMPVTFGGGITMQNGFPPREASVWNSPRSVHSRYQRSSIGLGS